jgi:MrcB-like, N-terminal domain
LLSASQKSPGPALSDLRSLLATFGTAHPRTLTWVSPSNPEHAWLSHDARQAVVSALPSPAANLIVSVSAGKGDPAETPWIAIMRRDITTTPQSGVYVVYLFCPDRQRIVLCIMLGVTRPGSEATLRRAPSTRDSELLRDLVARLRKLIPATPGFDQTVLKIGGTTLRSNQYDIGFIYGRTYDVAALPSNNDLVLDLQNLLKSYADIAASDLKGMDATPRPSPPRTIQRDRTRKAATWLGETTDLEAALQKRERATTAHERIVQCIVRSVDAARLPPAQDTQHIDVLICGSAIVEVKSFQRDDPQQIRDGVAQLLYYRFLYRDTIKKPLMILVLGRRPGASLRHLAAFAIDCGIVVAWLNDESFETNANGEHPQELRWVRATRSME